GLAGLERTLRAAQCHGLHGSDAEQADADHDDRYQHLDQADAAHPARRVVQVQGRPHGPQAVSTVHGGQSPLSRPAVIAPLISTVMLLLLSAGLLVSMHTTSCSSSSRIPEDRKTRPSSGPTTRTGAATVTSRMMSLRPVALSRPMMIQRSQSVPLAQVDPSSLRHMVTRALRRMASDRASCPPAVGEPVTPATRLPVTRDCVAGTATSARMAMTARVTISSISVKPACGRHPAQAPPPAAIGRMEGCMQ